MQPFGKNQPESSGKVLLPNTGLLVSGAALWGAAMAATMATAYLYWLDRESSLFVPLVVLYAAGGFCAFPITFVIAGRLSGGNSFQARFGMVFVGLAVITVGCTAVFFAICLLYANGYYEIWNYGRYWPLAVTTAGVAAIYQFLVMGARFYYPLGLVFLFIGSFWLARALR